MNASKSPIVTEEQAINFLHGRINYERVSSSLSATDFKLDRMRHLLEMLGNPQDRIPVVHIAGTKGKGSTAAMIAAGIQASGLRCGLFTSPHIERFHERIQVNREEIPSDALIRHVARLAAVTAEIDNEQHGLNPTFFELTTALGWLHFAEQQVDLAVLEVGLGGRLDSTNICRPVVTAITTISRDHTQILGATLAQIAAEKSGIIKPGIPVISGVLHPEARDVVARFALERGAPRRQLGEDYNYTITTNSAGQLVTTSINGESHFVTTPLLGVHQGQNVATAMAVMAELHRQQWPIDLPRAAAAFSQVSWPARIEQLGTSPRVILDAAHNWASVNALIKALDTLPVTGRRRLILSTTQDKDTPGLLRVLLPAFDSLILTQYQTNPRAVSVSDLARQVAAMTTRPFHVCATPIAAWETARQLSADDDLICIAGSFFLAAELRPVIRRSD